MDGAYVLRLVAGARVCGRSGFEPRPALAHAGKQQTIYTTMCENTAINDGAAATKQPKPIYKLSEIIEAMKEDRVELDVPVILACCGDEYCEASLNFDLLNLRRVQHDALLDLHVGLSQLMSEQMNLNPETMAIFAAAKGRNYRDKELETKFIAALKGEQEGGEA